MPRFEFSLSGSDNTLRLAGAVTCGSFAQAMEAIEEEAAVASGDRLEIGVTGFPPARFEAVVEGWGDTVKWEAEGRLAA